MEKELGKFIDENNNSQEFSKIKFIDENGNEVEVSEVDYSLIS